MKKYKGTSFIELAIAMSILVLIISLSIVRVNKDSLDFDATVSRIKTDIRRIIVRGQDDSYTYSLSTYKGYYIIDRDSYMLVRRCLDKHTHVLSGTRLEFKGIKRMGAPGGGGSLYVFNDRTKKLERITYIPASGRVTSYKDDYLKKKIMIDNWISELR